MEITVGGCCVTAPLLTAGESVPSTQSVMGNVTVSIIKVGQYVFGGYTDISWGKSIIPRHLSWGRGNRRILRDDMVFRGNGDGISRR